MPSNHRYTAEIRFTAADLDPSAVSRLLQLEPTRSVDRTSSSAKRIPFWAYNGEGEAGFQAEWASLEEGLEFLVARLSPARPSIVDLSKTVDGLWWCGHFQSSFDGGPTLSPKLLADLASFGLPLFIDNYFSNN